MQASAFLLLVINNVVVFFQRQRRGLFEVLVATTAPRPHPDADKSKKDDGREDPAEFVDIHRGSPLPAIPTVRAEALEIGDQGVEFRFALDLGRGTRNHCVRVRVAEELQNPQFRRDFIAIHGRVR